MATAASAEGENLPATQDSGSELQVAEQAEERPRSELRPVEILQERFGGLNRGKQIQLILGVTATLALVASVLLWSMSEDQYKLLYGNLSAETAGQISEVLQQEGLDYQLDEKTGEILVDPGQIHEIRMKLAAQGLPAQEGAGYELLDEQQGFGTSQFMEKARFNRAVEGELARSIAGINAVDSARVHLAIPKQSVFIRDRREPSASVLVNLKQGRNLGELQVASIVHLVASSIPDLKSDNVTVVDHTGKMLTKRDLGQMALSTAQFEYKRKMEEYYIERIERILMPIVGFEGVRAQVDAEIDFAAVERTQESFNPDLPAVRSEQVIEEESRGGDNGGIPGALTNQPPGVATAPEVAPEGGNGAGGAPSRKSRRSTFNYELDRTISHTRNAPGNVKRLSVAVVVDDKVVVNDDGSASRLPMTPEEMDRLTSLVKDAVGFSIQRGDSLNVMNASFMAQQELPEPPAGPFWEEPWFMDLAKQAAGILVAILLILFLLKPVLRDLTFKEEEGEEELAEEEEGDQVLEAVQAGVESMGLLSSGISDSDWAKMGLTQEEYGQMLDVLRKTVVEDPRLVAQVVKTWCAADESEEG